MRLAWRVAVIALAVVLAGCGDTTPTPTPAAQAGTTDQAPTPPVLSLPWPDGVQHTWTGGPHGWDSSCASTNCIGATVPDQSQRSGLDFGTGGTDWDVYPVAGGTVLYKGPFTDGFGAGVVIDHGGGFAVLYGHMDAGSLSATPDKGEPVIRTTKLGSTWCTGMRDCTATTGAHHLHLELRALTTKDGVASWSQPLSWNGQTIGGWRIMGDSLNYDGTATACGTTVTASSAGGPLLSDASDCSTATGPTPTATPTPTPTPEVMVVSGTWVAPKDGAKLTSPTLKLSAKASFDAATVSVSNLAFTVSWASTTKKACTATKADSSGVWSCKVDLWKLGAPLGKLAVSFDATSDTGDVAKAPAGTRTVTFAAPPPQPAGTTWTRTGYTSGDPFVANKPDTIHFRATWKEPEGAATKFLIYGLTKCLRYASSNDGGPCIVKGMPLNMRDLELLATVGGDKRSARIKVEREAGAGPDPYWSYLIRAVNNAGGSKFTILDPGVVCWQCTY
jgi:murein DD-endopeptidase MepM/ murein hydrolase activator NlpD